MDIGEIVNVLRPYGTVVSFLTFIGIVWWAYSSHRKQAYEEAANIPLDHDDFPSESPQTGDTQFKRNAS